MIIIIVNRLAKSGKDEMRQNDCEGAHGLVTSFPITNSLVALQCIKPCHCFFMCTIIEICSFFFYINGGSIVLCLFAADLSEWLGGVY